MRTGGVLIDASNYSVAVAGAVALNTEEMDMVATPKPKDLALFSLAAPIRLTGPLASPHVSSNASSIADSKAWQILDVADPIGVVLFVPRIILGDENHATDTSGVNPCLAALKRSDKGRLPTVKAVQSGFSWLTDLWRRCGLAGRSPSRRRINRSCSLKRTKQSLPLITIPAQ